MTPFDEARLLSRLAMALRRRTVSPLSLAMTRFGYPRAMEYTSNEIVERTGIPLRTIRLWTERKLLPKPLGKGPGTRYTEAHRIRIRVIAEFRAEGHRLDAIRATMKDMPNDEMRAFIGEASPVAAPPPPPASPAPPVDEARAPIDARDSTGASLPNARRWLIAELQPKLALMVGEDASPLVRRIAEEICERYGSA